MSHHSVIMIHTSTDVGGFMMPIIAQCMVDVNLFIQFVLIICVLCVVSDRSVSVTAVNLCRQVNIYAMRWLAPQKASGSYSW